MHLTAVNVFHPIRNQSRNCFITQHSLMTLANMYPFIPSVCLKRALICAETAVRTGLWHCLNGIHFSWLKAWEINVQFPIQHLNQCLRVTCRKARNAEGVFYHSPGEGVWVQHCVVFCLFTLSCRRQSVWKRKKKELKKLSFLLNLLELKLVLNLINFLFVHYFLKITMSYNYISVKTFLAFSCINVGKSFHLFIHYL